jgi:hypothetical protein
VCCLGRRQLSRRPARSTRAALASTLARATVWRGAARVLPRVAAAGPSPCSLDADCAGFYVGACHGVASGGMWRQLGRRPARSMRAALASTLARATVWREAARVLPRVAIAGPSPCSLNAGCAGFYAGARHGVARGGTCAASGGGSWAAAMLAGGVARGGTCAASGGGSWAAAMLARCGLRWLLRWRAPRSVARGGMCALLPRVAAAELSPCLLDVGCAGSGLCRLA